MAIFSRREIQRWLGENLQTIGREATLGQVSRLNDKKHPSNVVAAVWEVAVVYALRQLGEVRHEDHPGEGPKNPDVFFQTRNGEVEFLADIVTVSDAGLHDRNRALEFRMGIHRLMCKHGVGHRGFRTEIGSTSEGSYGDSVVRLALPPKQDLDAFVRNHFLAFAKQVSAHPESPHTHSVNQEGIELRAIYDPNNARFGSGSYPSYTATYSLTENPVANGLDNKRRQLKGSGFVGVCGVILCDGGCELLQGLGNAGPGAYTLDQVIRHFLDHTESIHFVLSLGHQVHYPMWSANSRIHELVPKLFLGRTLLEQEARFCFLREIPQLLPAPVETSSSAFPKRVHGGPLESPPSQEYSVSGNKVVIGAGALIELLGGVIKQDDWLYEEQFDPKPLPFGQIPKRLSSPAEAFKKMCEEGRRLVSMRILERENNDHDLVEFEFGDIDPARGDFQMPSDWHETK